MQSMSSSVVDHCRYWCGAPPGGVEASRGMAGSPYQPR
jgi:hypothetical protein